MGPVYTCDFALIRNTEVNTVTHVRSSHSFGRNNLDVLAFVLRFHNAREFPFGIATHFHNVRGVQWSAASLLSILANQLEQFPNLQVLVLEGNRLLTVDSDLFRHNPGLRQNNF